MQTILKMFRLVLLCALPLVTFVPAALVTRVDFTCAASGGNACTGGVVSLRVGNFAFSAAGISLFNIQGIPGLGSGPFSLSYHTSVGTISIATSSGTLSGIYTLFTNVPGTTHRL